MKEHITKEQMMEVNDVVLSTKLQSDRFDSLLNQLNVLHFREAEREEILETMAQIIDIKKLISMLKNYDDIEMVSSGKIWYVGVAGHINTENKELVDALWEAFLLTLK